jgi:di/tricarboxylate transporter
MAVNWKKIAGPNKSGLYFLLSFIGALILTFLLKEPSFTITQVYVLFLLFFAMGLWFSEAVPPFAVSIFIIAYLVFMLGNKTLNPTAENIDQYVSTFSSSIIWLMLGGFFLAAAMTKTKLDQALFKFTLKVAGTKPRKLLIGLMLTTMIASMLMSNTAATAAISLAFLQDEQIETSRTEKTQRVIVLIVIIVTVLLWLTTTIHGIKVAAVSAVPLVFLTLTGILKNKDVQGLPWDTLLLVAGGLSLGMALQNSGLLEHYAAQMQSMKVHYIILIVILAYMTMIFSNVMSNTATSTVLIPLGIAILVGFETQISVVIGLAASTALFLPVSTPPNAISYSTGMLQVSDFRIGGVVVGLLGPLLAILWVLFVA